jgi:hypothetical protein
LRRLLASLGWNQTRKVRGGMLVRSNGAGGSSRSALEEHLRNRRRNGADKASGPAP